MITLYHFELCPFSRQIRVLLKEKNLEFELVSEKYWQKNESFLNLNPASTTPVLKDGKLTVIESYPVISYLEEIYPDTSFLGKDIKERNEIRRLICWFNNKFSQEVSSKILNEKVISFFTKNSAPKSDVIRMAKADLYKHLDYMAILLEQRNWLGGSHFSLADIAAASHISVLDFLNDMPWQYSKQVKEWYSLVKSRPSFRELLNDYVQGFNPPSHYNDLDF